MSASILENLLSKLNNVNDPNIPPWALIIVECFKGLINVFHEFTTKNDELNNLKSENATLLDEINVLKLRVDDNEQRSRNSCLLIHGIEEKPNEDTDTLIKEVFQNELGITVLDDDIQRSHRLGPVRNNSRNTRSNVVKPRPIICRFLKLSTRKKIYSNKRQLKGQPIMITENLTATRYKIFQAALLKFGRRSSWTNDGRILTKVNNKIIAINTIEELNKYEVITEP
jgi:hypothetical protein